MAKKILLADDSITIQKVISITFASENYELIIVGDGESALNRAKETKPDLIMADVAMPGKNGYEVCEAIKNDPELSTTPVLLLAGTFEPLSRAEAERVKADDSIIKPFESHELLNKVAELLAKAPERAAAPAEAPAGEERPVESSWGEGDFLGFPEEIDEKPPIKGAEHLPDLDFLESGGLFEEPEKESAHGEDFADLEFSEEEFGATRPQAPEPSKAPVERAPAPSYPSYQPEPLEAEEIEPEPMAEAPPPPPHVPPQAPVETPPVEPPAPPVESGRPFWAENVNRDTFEDTFEDIKDISEFPDVYEEPEAPAPEGFAEDVMEHPAPVAEPAEEEAPFAAAEPRFGKPAPYEEPFEPAPVAGPFVEAAAEKAGEAVAKQAVARLEGIAVPREQVEEAVRKAVREIVEEIAWEVVPELAEELIRAEINKVKDLLARLK